MTFATQNQLALTDSDRTNQKKTTSYCFHFFKKVQRGETWNRESENLLKPPASDRIQKFPSFCFDFPFQLLCTGQLERFNIGILSQARICVKAILPQAHNSCGLLAWTTSSRCGHHMRWPPLEFLDGRQFVKSPQRANFWMEALEKAFFDIFQKPPVFNPQTKLWLAEKL